MKRHLLVITIFLATTAASAQTLTLPVTEWPAASPGPLVLFISGDGGFGSFFTGVCKSIQSAGSPVAAINARSYFWSKKDPARTAAAITQYLNNALQQRGNRQFIMAGYSFGADVMPFIVNRLPDSLKTKLLGVVLLAPSTSTDFEIHIADMLGSDRQRSMSVVAEINRMGPLKAVIIAAAEDRDFPAGAIQLKNYRHVELPGGHHFDGNTAEVAALILRYGKP